MKVTEKIKTAQTLSIQGHIWDLSLFNSGRKDRWVKWRWHTVNETRYGGPVKSLGTPSYSMVFIYFFILLSTL